jgi:hypothetical protein
MRVLLTCDVAIGHILFQGHETITDIMEPVQPPEIIARIEKAIESADKSMSFLKDTTHPPLKAILNEVLTVLSGKEITKDTYRAFVDRMKSGFGRIAQEVAEMPIVRTLPIATRRQLNFIVFNAITTHFHPRLFPAYRAIFQEQSIIVEKAAKTQKIQGQGSLTDTARLLKSVKSQKSVGGLINTIGPFFEAVSTALCQSKPSQADLLPILSLAITKYSDFGKIACATFRYLWDIWPSVGLSERIGYILETCSSTVDLLLLPPEDRPVQTRRLNLGLKLETAPMPKEDVDTPPVPPVRGDERKSGDDTIGLIEDLMDLMKD